MTDTFFDRVSACGRSVAKSDERRDGKERRAVFQRDALPKQGGVWYEGSTAHGLLVGAFEIPQSTWRDCRIFKDDARGKGCKSLSFFNEPVDVQGSPFAAVPRTWAKGSRNALSFGGRNSPCTFLILSIASLFSKIRGRVTFQQRRRKCREAQ